MRASEGHLAVMPHISGRQRKGRTKPVFVPERMWDKTGHSYVIWGRLLWFPSADFSRLRKAGPFFPNVCRRPFKWSGG